MLTAGGILLTIIQGVKEMPLGAWKREVEDEAFVSRL
jgi:hypothetical protein